MRQTVRNFPVHFLRCIPLYLPHIWNWQSLTRKTNRPRHCFSVGFLTLCRCCRYRYYHVMKTLSEMGIIYFEIVCPIRAVPTGPNPVPIQPVQSIQLQVVALNIEFVSCKLTVNTQLLSNRKALLVQLFWF